MSSVKREYHYHHQRQEVTVERYVPPPPPPPPPAIEYKTVHYIKTEVERSPPPLRKKVVFVEVERPPPPPRKKVVFVETVERPSLLPPLSPLFLPRPLFGDRFEDLVDEMIRSAMPQESSSGITDTKVIRLTPYQEAVLQQQFNRWPKNPQKGDIVLLAAETGLSEEDVLDWYSLQLTKLRKEQGFGGAFGIDTNY